MALHRLVKSFLFYSILHAAFNGTVRGSFMSLIVGTLKRQCIARLIGEGIGTDKRLTLEEE